MLDEDFCKSLEADGHHPEEYIYPYAYSTYGEKMRLFKKLFDIGEIHAF
jgi:hypothetical protein